MVSSLFVRKILKNPALNTVQDIKPNEYLEHLFSYGSLFSWLNDNLCAILYENFQL